ncbi:MAG: IucA/IucC family C-terminal-domain containing protein [Thermoactinomyces sp.]
MLLSSRISQVLSDEFGVFSNNEDLSRFPTLFSLRDFLKRESCLTLLLKWSDKTQTVPAAAASQIAKQYSFAVVVPALYAMSALNERLNLSLDNVRIRIGNQDQKRRIRLQLCDWETISLTGDRQCGREQLLKTLFIHHISPLWNHLHQLTGISRSVLWENLAVVVYWLYEKKLKVDEAGEMSYARDDFYHLLYDLPKEFFQEKIQPLRHFYHPPVRSSDSKTPVRYRKTCCLHYMTGSGGVFCGNCPQKQEKEQKSKSI